MSAEKPKQAGSDSGIGSGQNSMSSSAGKGPFINDVTKIWIFLDSPTCHTKMAVLLTPVFNESHDRLPLVG